MRRQEENSTLNIDVAGEIIPKCGKAIAGDYADYADYAVSHCSDIDLKRWMN